MAIWERSLSTGPHWVKYKEVDTYSYRRNISDTDTRGSLNISFAETRSLSASIRGIFLLSRSQPHNPFRPQNDKLLDCKAGWDISRARDARRLIQSMPLEIPYAN